VKILIADDDPTALLLLEAALIDLGHEVVSTKDGREAWSVFQQEGTSLLITDWMMPDLDGLELCRRIRAAGRARYTYILMLTAMSGRGRYLEGMAAGADDFITKPFDEDELAARLRVAERVLSLQGEVKTLEGLLNICAYCRHIQDDAGRWVQVEQYLHQHSDAQFSHGICPSCYPRVMAEISQWGQEHAVAAR
jgi:phosphoserine phosphatase RsbU/P